jgi:hypothetical protein
MPANEGPPQTPPPLLHPQPVYAGASQPGAAPQQGDVLASVLQAQAALLHRVLQQPARAGQDAIGPILGGGGEDDGDGSGLKLPGARGAAARQAFRLEAIHRPLRVARTVYENMSQALTADPAGLNSRAPSMRAYFTQETCFGNYRTLTYLGFAIATAFDWLAAGEQNLDRVKGLLALICCAVDQVALDNGSWTLAAHLLVCLPDPLWNYIQRNNPATNTNPFTRLADPTWTAAILGFLKDADVINAQRRQPPRPRQDDQARGPAPRAKAGAKGESKGDAAAAAPSSG